MQFILTTGIAEDTLVIFVCLTVRRLLKPFVWTVIQIGFISLTSAKVMFSVRLFTWFVDILYTIHHQYMEKQYIKLTWKTPIVHQ